MRHASSMIELVIAIVVMGIAVMTLPLLLSQTQNNNAYALQQEVILAARTKMGDMQTYRWDEHSLDNGRIGVLITNGDVDLNITSNGRRIGHILGNKRRKFFADENSSVSPANLGVDSGDVDKDDIDDFDDESVKLFPSLETTDLDYRFTEFNLNTTVVYISDDANYSDQDLDITFTDSNVSNSTNIKMLTLSISGDEVPTPFKLRSYSCNIGESELLRRTFP